MKKFLAMLLLLPSLVFASEGGFPLERAPDRSNDMTALQNGAKLFVNYCLNCHGASLMRYNRLRDIGLTEEQIKQNLMFTAEKVGDVMKTTMAPKDAKEWFGGVPPDLSVIARAKSSGDGTGADYIYTYLRTYYRDEGRSTGWNNLVYPNVGMPHVLWELQGQRTAKFVDVKDPHDPAKVIHRFDKFEQLTPGTMKQAEFDAAIADLVGFMQYMSEPVRDTRIRLGVIILIFLGIFTVAAWRLNAAYWKDIK